MTVQSSHRVDITPVGLSIDGVLLEQLGVSALTTVLGQPRVVPPANPAPDDSGRVPNTLVIWDAAGIYAFTKGADEVGELGVRLAEDPVRESRVKFDFHESRPRQVFSGVLTIAGQAPLEAIPEAELRKARVFLEASAGNWECTFQLSDTECGELRTMDFNERFAKLDTEELANIVRGAAHPFADVSIGYRAPKIVKKSSGKWKLRAATEPTLEISSFPFKLAVIQELMYQQEALKPKFDVHDFAADQGARSFDPNEAGYEVIPSVRNWFRKLPLPARLAEQVETLVLDGGNEIYLQLIPQWDGEDDTFVIKSLSEADLAPFTRLARVHDVGGLLSPRARGTLEKHGVIIE